MLCYLCYCGANIFIVIGVVNVVVGILNAAVVDAAIFVMSSGAAGRRLIRGSVHSLVIYYVDITCFATGIDALAV